MTTLIDEPTSRKVLRLPESLAREINRFRHKQELPSENEAMRVLLRYGLIAAKHETASRRERS